MRTWMALGTLLAALALAGCGANGSCVDACAKLANACNITQAGLSCDSSCNRTDTTCSECVNHDSCAQIASGKCQSECPGVQFLNYKQ